MKTVKKHISKSMKNDTFKHFFEEEKELLEVSLRLHEARKKSGLSQKELARAAHLTQQQVSRVENGANCNIMTYLKAGKAIGLRLKLSRPGRKHFAHT